MAFKPKSYAEALEKKQLRDSKRKPKERKQWKPKKRISSGNISAEDREKERSSRPLKNSRSEKKRKNIAWSTAVKDRDEWRCQWPGGCRTGDTRIEAHHIAERSLRPDLRYVLENGIALCASHHAWLPLHRKEAMEMKLLSDETYESQNSMRNKS